MKNALKQLLRVLAPASFLAFIRAQRDLPRRLAQLERQVRVLSLHQAGSAFGLAERPGACRSDINRHELQVFSQHGEDGILQFIFSQIGVTSETFIEFGMGDGRECNSAYLSLYQGWRGLLMDGNVERAATARAFYDRMLGPAQDSVTIVETWIHAENINHLIQAHGPSAEIDLLSIDMDGIDFWVWKAIEVVKPRVVVIEYSAVLGYERAITVPYAPDFVRWKAHPSGLYAGASLCALEELGRSKGYRLVGCNSHGINAFFVRDDVAPDTLPSIPPAAAYYPGDDLVLGLISPERFSEIAHLDFVDVGGDSEAGRVT